MFSKYRNVLKKPDENAEKQLRNEIEENGGLEKKDLPAMIFAAYIVIIPVALGLLLLLYLIGRLFLGF